MFNHRIAKTLKNMSLILFIIGIIASVLSGFIIMLQDKNLIFSAYLLIFLGVIGSLIGALLLYSWGHFIEDMDILCGRTDVEKIKKEDIQENQTKNNTFR